MIRSFLLVIFDFAFCCVFHRRQSLEIRSDRLPAAVVAVGDVDLVAPGAIAQRQVLDDGPVFDGSHDPFSLQLHCSVNPPCTDMDRQADGVVGTPVSMPSERGAMSGP